MENLYTQWYEMYVQKCKEQKVDEKDIKFKFEVGKSYLDTQKGYGVYVKERDGKKVVVDFWCVDDDEYSPTFGVFSKGEQNSTEWVYVVDNTETIGNSTMVFVEANCEMK